MPVDVLPVPALPCAYALPAEIMNETIKVALIMLRIYEILRGDRPNHKDNLRV
jgi:hypothetical protein